MGNTEVQIFTFFRWVPDYNHTLKERNILV